MAELLLIKPSELAQTTIIGGNVDVDKYSFSVLNVQKTVIESLLGTELYEKIKTDFEADSLTGDYLELYNNYVKPILKFQTTAEYIEVCSYSVDNGGIFTHQTDNKSVPERREVEQLAGKYRGLAETYIDRFHDWICGKNIKEYKQTQEGVDAEKNSSVIGGFYFGDAQTGGRWI